MNPNSNPASAYISSLQAKRPAYGGLLSPNTNYAGLMSNLKAPTPPTLSLGSNPSKVAPSASPAATTPTAPAVTAPAPALTSGGSSARDQYTSSLGSTGNTNSTANLLNQNSSNVSTPQKDVTAPDPFSAYATYLKGFQDKAVAADTRLADIQNMQDTQTLAARKQIQDDQNAQGGLVSGNNAIASRDSRNSNYSLANLGVAENAAARSSQVAQTALGNAKPLQIGDTYIDPSTGKILPASSAAGSGFTLGAGETRYQLDPSTGQYKAVGGGSTNNSGQYVTGSNPLVDHWAQDIKAGTGGAKFSDVPAELRSQVASALAQSGSSQSDILGTTVKSLSELQDMVDNNKGFEAAVGFPDVISHPLNFVEALFSGHQGAQLPGSSGADFVAKLNQVKNDVILPNLNLLHGLGRVTDREFQALTSAVTSLGPNLSEDQFKVELKNITDQINAKSAGLNAGSNSSSSQDNANSAFAEQWN